MFEEVFLKSIVKGIGKATGTMIVVGIVGGGIWYVSQPKTMKLKKKLKETKETKETQTLQMDSVEQFSNEPEQSEEHIEQIRTPRQFLQSENRYKDIFDKL